MKKFWLVFVLSSIICISCEKKKDNETFEESRNLFNQSEEVINSFIFQISQASDSLTIDSLSQACEKRIVDINFSFPPQTDLKLTEQENDSLFRLMTELISVKDIKLRNFREAILKDSMELNSIEVADKK